MRLPTATLLSLYEIHPASLPVTDIKSLPDVIRKTKRSRCQGPVIFVQPLLGGGGGIPLDFLSLSLVTCSLFGA